MGFHLTKTAFRVYDDTYRRILHVFVFFSEVLKKIRFKRNLPVKNNPSFLSSVRFLTLIILSLFSGHVLQGQNCTPGTTTFDIDLSASADAEWHTTEAVAPQGNCCEAPSSHQCMEMLFTLNPDANGVSIVFTVPTGSVYYQVNCGPTQSVSSNIVNICFDQEEPGPHSVTFCRDGNPSYEFSVYSTSNDLDVSLDPFSPVCEDSPGFMLSGGSPSGGTYFINGNAMAYFNVGALGPGDHEIVYQYTDPNNGCIAFASQILTVVELPEISWVVQEFCDYEGMAPLNGASPPGGIYSGSLVSDNQFNVSAAIPGNYDVDYYFADEHGCSASSTGTVIVNEQPLANAGTDQTIPDGTTTILDDALEGGTGNYNYSWQPADKLLNANVLHPQTLPLTQSTLFTLTVTDTETGCFTTDQVVINITGGDIHISEIVSSPASICYGEVAELWVLPGGGSGDYTYSWTADPPDLPDFPSTLESPLVSPEETTTYTVTVHDANFPAATPATGQVTVTVDPLPVVELNIANTVCANTPNFALTGGFPAGGTYYLLDTDSLVLDLPYIDFNDFLPNNIGEGEYLVMYEYTDPFSGCTNAAIEEFEILPWIKAQFYINREDLCNSDEIRIANHSTGATNYRWEFSDGTIIEYQDENDFLTYFPDSIYTFPASTNIEDYTITLIVTNDEGCSDIRERSIRVYPDVEAAFTASATEGCSSLEVAFNSQSEGPILFHFWDFGDGTFSVEDEPTHTFVNNSDADTTFTVVLTVLSSNYFCFSTDTIEIVVYPAIEAGLTLAPFEGCNPLEVEFGNLSTGATGYEWDFGNGITFSGETPPDQTFTNTTNDIIQYFITLEASNEHCSDTAMDSLLVYPDVTASFDASETIGCGPLDVSFEFLYPEITSHNATHFSWDFGDGATSFEKDPVHTFENNTDATLTYTVWLKVRTDYFCSDSVSMDITVHPTLKADFDFSPAQACNEFDLNIVNTSYGAGSFSWDMDDGTIYNWTGSQPGFSHFFEHDETIPVTYNITLLVSNAEGCTDSITRPFTMFPKIESSFTPSVTEGCNPLEVFFDNQSSGADNHLWEFDDGGSSTQDTITHIFENTSFTDVAVFDVWLYSESEYLCRDSINEQITVYPKVKANFAINDNQGCSPFLVTIDNSSMGADSLSWDFGDGTTDNATDNLLTHLFENTTDEVVIYTVGLIATNSMGCTDTLTREITVFPEVKVSYNHPLQGCHPFDVAFENLTTNAGYYHWDFGNGVTYDEQNPEHIFQNLDHFNPAIYEISLFASSVYGCSDAATSSIQVDPKPDASFNIVNSPGCSPHELMILHQSQGATDFLWDFGDDSGSFDFAQDTITHLFNLEPGNGPGTFNIVLEVENDYGCRDTLAQQAVIYPNIQAEISATILEGCHPLTVDFTNSSYGASAQTAYFWDYGNGNTSQNFQEIHSHTFHNFNHTRDTVFTVILSAFNENGCMDTDTLSVRVLPRPRAFFSIPNTPGCAPHEAIIHNWSIGVQDYLWDMGDGNTFTHGQEHFTHTYTQPANEGPGNFMLTLDVENQYGCTHSHSQNIVIYPEIIPEFVTDNEGCHPHTAEFENLSLGGNMFLWDFDNGNTSQASHPQQTFTNYSHTDSKSYHVNLLVESSYGCSAQTTQEIIVRPVPKPLFQLSPFTGCSPFTPLVSNLSVGGHSYHWDMGNAELDTQDSTFYHSWQNTTGAPVQFPITLTITNEFDCVASDTQNTTVYPEVTAAFTTEDEVWEGCSPLPVKFDNTSSLAESYKWDFADDNTSSSVSPLHVFSNTDVEDRIFPVELVALSVFGCTDTLVRDIKVYPSPEALFIAQPKKQPYPETTITLTNQTNPGYWNFQWEFGDGNHAQTPSPEPFTHTYVWDENDMSTREYIVSLHASSQHCSDRFSQSVTITSPIPKADFTSLNAGCEPFTVQFSNESLYAHSFRWDFGDGSISDDPAPEHTFMDPGEYEVVLVALGDGGRDTTYHHVEVIENPTALFELETIHVNIPDAPLRLINNSLLADFYFWDFGDGNTSYEFEPEYYYTEPGIYDISLVATRNTQPLCFDTLTIKHAIRVDEACRIIFPDAFIPSHSGPNGGHVDPNNPSTHIFHPVYEGVDDYVLEIFNRWGELIFRSTDPNVGWDGYHNGKLAKMDVYVWKVTGQCSTGSSITMAGDVTLYR